MKETTKRLRSNQFATLPVRCRHRRPACPRWLLLLPALLLAPVPVVRSQFTLVSVGAVNDGGYASGVAVVGNYAYLANSAEGLRIYDVSNPAQPIRVAQTNNGGLAIGLAVRSNLVYLAADHEGLQVYDVSQPANPVHLAQATNDDFIAHSTAVALSGDYAFLTDASSGLWVCDISNPINPVVVCQTTLDGGLFHSPVDVAISGHCAYTACVLEGLRIYDISTPASPVLLGQATNSTGSARAVAVNGNTVYLANSNDGLRIYEVSDPANPLNIGYAAATKTGGQHFTVTATGPYAYVGNTVDGLHIYDVSDPTSPTEVGSANVGFVRGIAISGNNVFLANDTSGLRIFRQVPRLSITLTGTNTVLLSWPATPLSFTPQRASAMGATHWETITNVPSTTGATTRLLLTPPSDSEFYRLISQ